MTTADKYDRATHGLNGKHKGTDGPVSFHVNAQWHNSIDVVSKDGRDNLRLKYSLEKRWGLCQFGQKKKKRNALIDSLSYRPHPQ